MTIDERQVIEELSKVTKSSGFRSRKQMCNFLSYIVTEKLGGRGRYLKQYTIAVYGLGKPEDFSPGENPLVRVEAGRLRNLLTDFYQQEGKDSAIRIELPKGSYQPNFIKNESVENKDYTYTEQISKAYSKSLKVLLGFKCFSPTPENLDIYYLVVRDFTITLNKFPFTKILSASPNNAGTLSAHDYINYIRTNFDADFLLKMDFESLDGRLSLKCLLMHTVTEEIVWGQSFDIEGYSSEKDFTAIYRQIINNLFALDNGIAHQYRVQHLQSQQQIEHNEQQLALIYLHNAYIGFSQQELQNALRFCEHYLKSYPHDNVAIAVNLHLYLQEYFSGYQITEHLDENYHALVNAALRINSGSAETYLFHAFSAYLRTDFDLAASELKRALELNPDSAFNQFFAGSLYYILGDFTLGDSCLKQAVSMNNRHPDWYHIMTSLSAYRMGDHDTALVEAKKVYVPWGAILRSFLYKKMDMQKTAEHELLSTNKQTTGVSLSGAWVVPDILIKNTFLHELLTDLSNN